MRIAIAGGTGYLGSKLISKLLQEGHDVICIKRPESNIEHVPGKERVLFFDNDSANLKQLFSKYNVDCVVSTICNYLVPGMDDQDIIESNLIAPLHILNMYLKYNNYLKPCFITMDTGLAGNFNIYSQCKKQFADFGRYYAERDEVIFINVLLENFYGKDEPPNRFLMRSIRNLRRNKPLDLTPGTQHRDFIHIDDVVDNIILMIRKVQDMNGYTDIPLGSGEAPTIREVMEYLKESTGSRSELRFGAVPFRKNEPNCIADLTRLREIGGTIRYNWKEGMKLLTEEEKNS